MPKSNKPRAVLVRRAHSLESHIEDVRAAGETRVLWLASGVDVIVRSEMLGSHT